RVLRAEGVCPLPVGHAGVTLWLRLRHDDSRPRNCLPGIRRHVTGMATLGKDSTGCALADADRRAPDCPGDIHSSWCHRHDRGLYRDSAQRHVRAERANASAGNGDAIIPFATAKELLDFESYTKENCRREGKLWYLNIAALMS